MVSSVLAKVRRLETASGGGGGGLPPCDHCGWGGDNGEPDDYDDAGSFEIVFVDPDEDLGPEFCPECGRRLVHAVWFDDDPRAPWNA